ASPVPRGGSCTTLSAGATFPATTSIFGPITTMVAAGDIQRIGDHRLPGDRMHDLGDRGFHPRAAASGENGGGEGRLAHQIRPKAERGTIAPICRNYDTRIVSKYINILKIFALVRLSPGQRRRSSPALLGAGPRCGRSNPCRR